MLADQTRAIVVEETELTPDPEGGMARVYRSPPADKGPGPTPLIARTTKARWELVERALSSKELPGLVPMSSEVEVAKNSS